MSQLTPQFIALAIGLVCGLGAYVAGMPLPWMLGPMIGNTIAALARAPIAGPNKLRPLVIPVIGVMLGAGVTPEVLQLIPTWLPTLILLPVFLLCAGGGAFLVYRRIGGYDPVTAFFSAAPGGLNEMLIVGGEAGGDERRIALAHAARILLVISFVALFFGAVLGVSSGGQSSNWVGLLEISLRDYVVLGLCALIGMWLGKLARLPAAPVFGPMIISGIAHAFEIVTAAPPTAFIVAAQITMGTIIGTRFAGATLSEIWRDLWLASLASLVMLVVAVGFAEAISVFSGMPLAQAFLAYSPGGLTEMALLTLALGQNVTYVSLIHVARITMVIAAAPLVFKLRRK